MFFMDDRKTLSNKTLEPTFMLNIITFYIRSSKGVYVDIFFFFCK